MTITDPLIKEAIGHAQTKWLENWLGDRLPSMLNLTDTPSDMAKAPAWGEELEKMMVQRGLTSPEQQKNRWTDARNALKTLNPNHPALEVVGLTPEEFQAINAKARDGLYNCQTKFISDPQAIAERAVELLDSREWSEVALGVAVLTGRRCSEILISHFEYKTAFSLFFSKPVKRGGEGVPLSFEIPTLARAHKVLKAIAKLHHWLKPEGLTPREVNARYEEAVKRASRKHFRGLVPAREGHDELYTHLFRAVYAVIAAHWYCPPTVNELDFRAAIQGHFEILNDPNQSHRLNLMSQRHYWDYQISDGNGNIDGRLGIKLSQRGVEVLERFRLSASSQPMQSTLPPKAIAFEEDSNTRNIPINEATDTTATLAAAADAIVSGAGKKDNSHTSVPPEGQPSNNPATSIPTADMSAPSTSKKRHWSKRPIGLHTDTRKRFEAIAKKWRLSEAETLDRLLDLAEGTLNNPTASEQPQQPQQHCAPSDTTAELHEILLLAKALTENLVERNRLQQLTEELDTVRAQFERAEQLEEQQRQQIEALARENHDLATQLNAVRDLLQFLFGSSLAQQQPAAASPSTPDKNNPPAGAQDSQPSPDNPPTSRRGRSVDEETLGQINQAVDRIVAYNNAPGRAWEDKWAITLSTLKKHRVVTCAQETIAHVLQQRSPELDEHHKLHGLGSHHNRRHKASIKDAIDFS